MRHGADRNVRHGIRPDHEIPELYGLLTAGAELLIRNEATARLDNKSPARNQGYFDRKLKRNTTVSEVVYRLDMISEYDHILVMKDAHIVESEGRRVNLSLQHNLQNTSENTGNQVRLIFPERLEKEPPCFSGYCKITKTIERKVHVEKQMQPDLKFPMRRSFDE